MGESQVQMFDTQKPLGFVMYNKLTNAYRTCAGEPVFALGETVVAVLTDDDILIYTDPVTSDFMRHTAVAKFVDELREKVRNYTTPEDDSWGPGPGSANYHAVAARFKGYCQLFTIENSQGKSILLMDDLGEQLFREYLTAAVRYIDSLSIDSDSSMTTTRFIGDNLMRAETMMCLTPQGAAVRERSRELFDELSDAIGRFMKLYSLAR